MSPHPGVECVLTSSCTMVTHHAGLLQYPSIFPPSILISAECRVELETKVRADVIITKEAPTRVFSPSSTFNEGKALMPSP